MQDRGHEPEEWSEEFMEVSIPPLLAYVQRSINKPTKEALTFPFLEFRQLSLILCCPGLQACLLSRAVSY